MRPERSTVGVGAASRRPAEDASVEQARPAARSRASALQWIIAIGAGGAAVLLDPIVRAGLPTVLYPIWPLVTFGCGMLLSRRVGQSRATVENGASRIDRAAAELNLMAIDRPVAETQGLAPGGRGHDNVAVLAPVKVRYLGVERAVQDLGHYETFTAILGKQTKSVADLGTEAAASILTSLQGIADKVSALLTSIGRSRSSEQVARTSERIEADMAACRSLLTAFVLGQQTNASDSLRQRSQLVIDTKSVLDVLDGVKKVAQQTTILSLNVSIEAARVGEAGRGFTVIATEIRKLSAEVQALSGDVHARVKALMQTVTVDMQGQAKRREEVERVAIARISETLDGLTEHFTAFVAHQSDVLQKVETDGMAIARPITDLTASITFQETIRQQLDQLNGMAEIVGDHINNLASMLADDDLEMEDETLSAKLDSIASAQGRFGQV